MKKKVLPYIIATWIPFSVFSSVESYLTLNDAIVNTLQNQKEIQISMFNIDRQSGVLQQSGGPFDPVLAGTVTDIFANTVQKLPDAKFSSRDVIFQGSIQKQTRSGTSFSLNGFQENFKSHHLPNTRATQVFFQIDQPLLRNFLYGINRQIEEANFLELQAVNWDTLQTISNKIFATIVAYWEVVAAQQSVIVLENAIQRLESLQDFTQKLIHGEQLAAEDINQIVAVILAQKRDYFLAQGTLYADKQQLIFAMGDFDESSTGSFEKHFKIDESLPPITVNELALENKKDQLIRLSFDRRFDVQAAETRELETSTLLLGAKNQVLPQLDVVGSITVNDLHPLIQTDITPPGNLLTSQQTALSKNYSTNYAIGVTLSIPFNNDAALGFLEQQQSLTTQSILQTQLLKQNLISLILQTINNQIVLRQELRKADEIVVKYTRLVKDETERLQAGFGTVFVLLDFETQLINAQLSQVNLSKQYIQGLAQLRFLTGTLVQSNTNNALCKIDVEDVLTYPDVN